MLELDVHLSRDGHPVVRHDPDLSRTTGGTGQVSEWNLADIRRLDAGQGERVPTLAEVVDLARGRAQLYIELKGQQTPEPVVRVLRDAHFVQGAIAGSFYPWLPQKVKFLEPALRTSILVREADRYAGFLGWAQAVGADFVHPCWERAEATLQELLPPEQFADIRRQGLGIILWHEERPPALCEMARLDVDGICTNTPDVLAQILQAAKR